VYSFHHVKAAGDVAAANKAGANMAIYRHRLRGRNRNLLPRQLLQSNIWAHSQLFSAKIARPTEVTPREVMDGGTFARTFGTSATRVPSRKTLRWQSGNSAVALQLEEPDETKNQK
jgi:hypothetical protein